jgi:hypothetical protein
VASETPSQPPPGYEGGGNDGPEDAPVTQYAYDKAGNVIAVTDPSGQTMSSFAKSLPKMELKGVEETPPRFGRLRPSEGEQRSEDRSEEGRRSDRQA